MMKFAYQVLLGFCLTSSLAAFAGSGNHGGDGILITLFKAQQLAGDMVRSYRAHYANDKHNHEAFRNWFAQNGEELALDVLESPLHPLEESMQHDALTSLTRRAPVRISLPSLRKEGLNKTKIAALLIHESMHHLGVRDELFAYFGAAIISEHWEKQNRINPALAKITQIPPRKAGPQQWHGSSVVMMDDKVFTWGGGTGAYEPLLDAEGYLYSPARNSWKQISTQGQPANRVQAATLWTGREVLIWGGQQATHPDAPQLKDGAAYNPTTNSWRSLSTVDAPREFPNRCIVWTGSEMIVAKSPAEPLYRYDPSNDHWHRVPASAQYVDANNYVKEETEAFWTGETGNPATANRVLLVHIKPATTTLVLDFFSPSANTWISKPLYSIHNAEGLNVVDIKKQGHSVLIKHLLIIAVVGTVKSYREETQQAGLLVFNAKTESWHFVPNSGLAPDFTRSKGKLEHHDYSFAAMDTALWVQDRSDAVGYLFDLQSLKWSVFDLSDTPHPYHQESSVIWTGESILSMSGVNSKRLKNFGTMIEFPAR